jgi:two-component system LytT family response regulator
MPGLDGFEVLRRVSAEHLPAIIFVTGFDQFALDAFAVHALDYLLKPPSPERLHVSLQRVRRDLARDERSDARALAGLIEGADRATGAPIRRLALRERDRYRIVRDDDVLWIEAAGNYVEIHTRDRTSLLRDTLADLEQELDPERFRRIHRRIVVNLDHVREIVPTENGDYRVLLDSGAALKLSRRFRNRLLPDS